MKRIFKKALKITGISLGSLLVLMFFLPVLLPGFVATKIKAWAAHAISGELNFSKARLSFFNHFPSLTLTLYDFSLKGSAPFSGDTLVSAREVALGVNLSSVFSKSIDINEIYLTRGTIHVLVDEKGAANYNVYRSDTTGQAASTDTSSASLKIRRIQIDGTDLVYDDRSIPLLITADGVNYLGKGNLSQDVFDLSSRMQVDTFDLDYNRQHYIGSKRLNADLITQINTRSLSFIFQKNDLRINSLPVQLKGRFDFLASGYNMDFRLNTDATNLHDMLTALPPEYAGWLDKTDIQGTATMDASLIGRYDSKKGTMPDLNFEMTIREGSIASNKAPKPIEHLFLNLESKIPGLNPDSFYVNIDSLFFNIDRDYFSSVLRLKGLHNPHVYARIRTALNLEEWDRAIGLKPYSLKGRLSLDLDAEGQYATKVIQKGLRSLDTVVTSIPSFHLHSALEDGYLKYAALPKAMEGISYRLEASCPDHDYRHTRLNLDNIRARFLTSVIGGSLRADFNQGLTLVGSLHTILHLSDISQVYPVDSLQLSGDLKADVETKGVYDPGRHLFPTTTATLDLSDGRVLTKYYPHPIDQIRVSARITNTSGTMHSLKVQLTPVSFRFEDQPFTLQADLSDFDNLRYSIRSNGVMDLGRMYQVFARQGMDLKGFIRTNLSLRGLQSDATSGHYERLDNKGTMEMEGISLSSDLFPKPLLVRSGLFRFDQEKMWFDRFNASYGSSHFALNGYLSNLVAYATQKGAPLSGSFDVTSPLVVVDELAAFAGTTPATPTPAPSGVIIVPGNLSLALTARVGRVTYNGLTLDSCKGEVRIDSGNIRLRQLGFTLIGTPVLMDATYGSLSPKKATFTYHINAQNFNIRRAYNEIKLFRDLATSASKAEGIVSLDYQLSGDLDADMHPIMPSLKGGGSLSLADVKVHGLKIFGAVSKATGKDSVDNPHLSKVTLKSSIAHNLITLERTKMKVLGFRPRFEGQVGFDGRLNLQFRLGLPPLGIIGIPMTITGTEDNPKVHLRREQKGDELQGTDSDDQ